MNHGGVDLDPLVAIDDERKPLRSKLLAVPSLKAKYLQFVRTIAEQSLNWETAGPKIAAYRQLIVKEVEADTRKLTTYEAFVKATNPEATDDKASGSLRYFFDARRKYLLEHKEVAAAKPLAAAKPAETKPEMPAEKVVTGLGAQLTSKDRGPNSPQIIVNELMASNSKTIKDPQGKFHDWIEIHNPTDKTLDLSGVYVTDTDRAPRKWQFPKGTTIQANGYLLLWADENGKATDGLHLNFKLSSKGEDVFLVDTDERGNAVLDHVRFEKQTDDVAFGRNPQKPEEWVPLFATPGAANRVSE